MGTCLHFKTGTRQTAGGKCEERRRQSGGVAAVREGTEEKNLGKRKTVRPHRDRRSQFHTNALVLPLPRTAALVTVCGVHSTCHLARLSDCLRALSSSW